jgi:hypothetical protein
VAGWRIGVLFIALQHDPAVFEEARRSFEQGVELLDKGEAKAAIEKFEHSLALRESLSALYNLGLAYRKADRFKDALRTFERFLDWAATENHTNGVEHAKMLADQLRGTIGRVSLVVVGGAESVRIDGAVLGDHDGTYGLVLDPGQHVFEATKSGAEPIQTKVHLDPGANLEVRLAIPSDEPIATVVQAPPPVTIATAPPPALPHAEPLVEQWWFWTLIGVVAAGAAAGIIVAVNRPEPEYDRGTNDVLLQALKSR